MKSNELRIGNLVNANGDMLSVTGADIAYFDFNGNDYSPIPLTPEILEKAGFGHDKMNKPETLNINWFCIKPCNKMISGQIFKAGIRNAYDVELFHNTTLLFVHQLQNLYFALTGEELPIEL